MFAVPVFGQNINAGPRGGLYLEDADIYIGGEIDVEPLSLLGYHFIFSVDNIFGSGDLIDSRWLLSLNAVKDMLSLELGTFYAGGGVGFYRTKMDLNDEKLTDAAVSILGGVRFNVINKFRPFGNIRLSLGDDTAIILEGGLHFSIF